MNAGTYAFVYFLLRFGCVSDTLRTAILSLYYHLKPTSHHDYSCIQIAFVTVLKRWPNVKHTFVIFAKPVYNIYTMMLLTEKLYNVYICI